MFKRLSQSLLVLFFARQRASAIAAGLGPGLSFKPAKALTLGYTRPAREWLESLPFGNGRLGGTVFGRAPQTQ